jgi:hypothetical protein
MIFREVTALIRCRTAEVSSAMIRRTSAALFQGLIIVRMAHSISDIEVCVKTSTAVQRESLHNAVLCLYLSRMIHPG